MDEPSPIADVGSTAQALHAPKQSLKSVATVNSKFSFGFNSFMCLFALSSGDAEALSRVG